MTLPVQIINETTHLSQQSDPTTTYLVYATWSLVCATIFIGYLTIRFSQKQHQRNALIDIFKMLNNEGHKQSETMVIDRLKQNDLYDVGMIHQNFEKYADVVMRNYDQLGLLLTRRGLIPKKDDVFDIFGTLVVVSHLVLFQEINRRRLINESYFMINFTKLAIDCYFYWKRKNHIPRHPVTNQPITEDEINRWKESLPK